MSDIFRLLEATMSVSEGEIADELTRVAVASDEDAHRYSGGLAVNSARAAFGAMISWLVDNVSMEYPAASEIVMDGIKMIGDAGNKTYRYDEVAFAIERLFNADMFDWEDSDFGEDTGEWDPPKRSGFDESKYVHIAESLCDHAKAELTKAGLFDKDSDYGGMVADAVMELMASFGAQGHSGFSAGMTRELFNKLSQYDVLTEITDAEEDWMRVDSAKCAPGQDPIWQSTRKPSLFSHDGGTTYYDLNELPEGQDVSHAVYHKSFPCSASQDKVISEAQRISKPFAAPPFFKFYYNEGNAEPSRYVSTPLSEDDPRYNTYNRSEMVYTPGSIPIPWLVQKIEVKSRRHYSTREYMGRPAIIVDIESRKPDHDARGKIATTGVYGGGYKGSNFPYVTALVIPQKGRRDRWGNEEGQGRDYLAVSSKNRPKFVRGFFNEFEVIGRATLWDMKWLDATGFGHKEDEITKRCKECGTVKTMSRDEYLKKVRSSRYGVGSESHCDKCESSVVEWEYLQPKSGMFEAWRGPAFLGRTHAKTGPGLTAADIVRHEQEDLGKSFGIGEPVLDELEGYPASQVVWVTKEPRHASQHGKVTRVDISPSSRVLASDGANGFLVLKDPRR
jgi:hypothetical protein